MSPVRSCTRHGAVRCARCAAARRARQTAARRPYSDTAAYRAMVDGVIETYGDRCVYCAQPIDLDAAPRSDRSLVLAHVLAHADGGAFELDNLRPAHLDCNRSAGTAPIGGTHG